MTLQSDVFNITVSMFTAESEETRAAAAFAAGGCQVPLDITRSVLMF